MYFFFLYFLFKEQVRVLVGIEYWMFGHAQEQVNHLYSRGGCLVATDSGATICTRERTRK